MTNTLLEHFSARVAAGELEIDEAQRAVAARLSLLADRMAVWRPRRGGVFSRVVGSRGSVPRGLYIHGSVGRGKTMLMDMFAAAVEFKPIRRIHFHEFMAEAHDLINAARATVDGDPIPHAAAEIARGAGLLCFDEFHITDIADAMIIGRLFTHLFERRVVVVATSNVHPKDLYRNGLNRELFLPFIDLLMAHMDVVELKALKDFRLEKLAGRPLYFSPLDEVARREMRGAFQRLTGKAAGQPIGLDVKGRTLLVPEAAEGVARFTFGDLCTKPLGSLDYLAIARAFHTVLIEGIPAMTAERRAEARRFVNLIDTLYDGHVGLIASAAVEPDALYPAGDQAFLFERTASRLIEMRSEAYLQSRGRRMQSPVIESATGFAGR